jgi:myo-inositol-1(or 4)-monophosphatase
MDPILNIAINAARLAGKLILRAQDQAHNLSVVSKGHNDFATQVDKAAEDIIVETIHKAYPDHAILAEESGYIEASKSDHLWIIDPLDGTTNFLHGFPQYCISIAFQYQGKLTQGVVYDPVRDELFTAVRGRGARMNDQRLRVSTADKLEQTLLGTGFPFRELDYLDNYLIFFKRLIPYCAGIRRAGAAALDIAYVAAGRLDGFWEFGLKPWDVAAAALFVQEAGGYVTTIEGDNDFLGKSSFLTASPKIHQLMLNLYQECIAPRPIP